MAEDFDNHRRIFDGGDDLQGAAAVRAVFDVDVEDPFEQPGLAHARRFSLGRDCVAIRKLEGRWKIANIFRSKTTMSSLNSLRPTFKVG
jgi:hypothetical protein